MAKHKLITSRKINKRAPYDRVLIMCEGETEKIYFIGLVNSQRLSTVNIPVLNPKQNTPSSLFKEAKKEYQNSEGGDSYDKVFCVFDKDKHACYEATKNDIRQKDKFECAYSEPSFEYWLLLHFKDTTRIFTCCDEILKDKVFRECFPQYHKTDNKLFDKLQSHVDTACINAEHRNAPTNVYKLVNYLCKLNNNK